MASRDEMDVAAVDDRIVSLESNATPEHTTIEALQSEDEQKAVLAKLQEIVGTDDYHVEDEDGDLRLPAYGDIAMLTRTRDFGRELLGTAEEYDFPMAYEGLSAASSRVVDPRPKSGASSLQLIEKASAHGGCDGRQDDGAGSPDD